MARKAISKSTRFEVFKRDGFKCQYCGTSAPDAVLHVDHINPVAKGGDNNILNIVTACIDCNLGKSAKKLSDDTAVKIQLNQLRELQELRMQKEMMANWRKELVAINDMDLNVAIDALKSRYNITLNEHGLKQATKAIKKYGLDEYMTSMDLSSENYLKDMENQEQRENFITKIERICFYREKDRKDPVGSSFRRLCNVANSKWSWCNKIALLKSMNEWHKGGFSVEEIEKAIMSSRSSYQFEDAMEAYNV